MLQKDKEQKGAAGLGFSLETREQEGLCQQVSPLLQSLKGQVSPVVNRNINLKHRFHPSQN